MLFHDMLMIILLLIGGFHTVLGQTALDVIEIPTGPDVISAPDTSLIGVRILMSNGKLVDVAEASDQLNIQSLSKTVSKYFICYPKELKM